MKTLSIPLCMEEESRIHAAEQSGMDIHVLIAGLLLNLPQSANFDNIAKIIAHLEHIATRPQMFSGGNTPEATWSFLCGFDAACWGLGYSFQPYLRCAVAIEKGYKESSLGPVPEMQARGMTDAEIVDELFAIEILCWKRVGGNAVSGGATGF